jgi:hypothetical protein
MNIDNYFDLPQVSNSDLSELRRDIYPPPVVYDPTVSFAFGNLLDAITTEPERIDFINRRLDGVSFNKRDFNKAEKMKNAFLRDSFCFNLIKKATFQDIIINEKFEFQYKGMKLTIPARCKWDILRRDIKLGADLKSTDAKTQSEFESAVEHFQYDRQAAWYMDLTGIDDFIIIGVSKKNFKVFKVFINRKNDLYLFGRAKYSHLAFKYKMLYGI